MLEKTVGWIFLMLCPFISGTALFVLFSVGLKVITVQEIGPIFTTWLAIWSLIYMSWFSNSKYQYACLEH